MKIEPLDAMCVKITLTNAELQQRGYDPGDLTKEGQALEELMTEMLAEARKAGLLEEDCCTRILAQLYECREGGCILYFTSVGRDLRFTRSPVVYRFARCEDMIEALLQLFQHHCHRVYKSSLYRYQNSFYVVVYSIAPSDPHVAAALLEYGEQFGKGEACRAFLEEHGAKVIDSNAMDVITYYLA